MACIFSGYGTRTIATLIRTAAARPRPTYSRALPPRSSCSFEIGDQTNRNGMRCTSQALYRADAACLATMSSLATIGSLASGGLKLSRSRIDRAGLPLSFSRSSRIGWTMRSFGWLSFR